MQRVKRIAVWMTYWMICLRWMGCTAIVEHRENGEYPSDSDGTDTEDADSTTATTSTDTTSDDGTDTQSASDTGQDTGDDTDTGTSSDTATDTGTDNGTDTSTNTEDTDTPQDTGDTDTPQDTEDTDTPQDTDDTLPSDCTGLDDFTPCLVKTTPNDRDYDICIKGVCQSPGCGTADCNVPGPYFSLADTGQLVCFNGTGTLSDCPAAEEDEFYGQDAQYGWDINHAPGDLRYIRNLDAQVEPVVEDMVTELSWQGCQAGLKGDNCEMTDASVESQRMTWTEALNYCDTLNWGGYRDWRLPDEFALQSIVNYGAQTPAIDEIAFPETVESFYWTSSSSVNSANSAWRVSFNRGDVDTDDVGSAYYVRCVRSEPVDRASRFVRDTSTMYEAVVTDNATGLVWHGCTAGKRGDNCDGAATDMTWQEALAYCVKSTWGNYNDWRLPNVTELRSIADNQKAATSIDSSVFPATVNNYYWSSSGDALGEKAWYVSFSTGNVFANDKGYNVYVRCVRK